MASSQRCAPELSATAALRLLESRGETRWDLGLSRIRALLGRMGDPQDAVPSIHVAGTNGKGTVCALLASILKESGLRVGLYTSPHLLDVRERIAVDGKPVPARAFAAAVDAARRAERDPATYFELLTAAAFHHFREAGAQVSVVEVGLGGRLDATNALKSPLLTVITSIGLDHTVHLGKTLSAIADEKAGILKPGVPCLCGELAPEPLARIRRRAGEAGAPLTQTRTRLESTATDWSQGRQSFIDPGAGGVLSIPLPGMAALRNAALALDALTLLRGRGLRIGPEAVARGLENARWPGRFQIMSEKDKVLVLDGAHNVPALRAFLETWDSSPFARRDALFIVGMLEDKDVDGMLDILASRARRAVAARAGSPRALGPVELARRMEARGIEVVARAESARDALKAWKADGAKTAALCGSFYLVGDALRMLR